ncbi:MAG: TonB-dependent receptor [Flavobacteriaceae bacterium]
MNNQFFKKRAYGVIRKLMPLKFVAVFFMLCAFQMSAHASKLMQAQEVNILAKNSTLEDVFQQIEDQTSLRFFYDSNEVDVNQPINQVYKDVKLSDVLASVLEAQNLTYTILKNQIILKKETQSQTSLSPNKVQDNVIEGQVTNEGGGPLPGVNILVEGTNNGAMTDFDGNYSVEVNADSKVLIFSYVGFKTKPVKIENESRIDVVMEEDVELLDQVVLIGYGKQKREDVSGSVSSVQTDDIVQASAGQVGFDRALGGLVKGVQVSQNSGRPGSPIRMNIRGVTSPLSSGGGLNQPLYVIDGVPFNTEGISGSNPLLTINPNDIETFDILKDAAATSIYGSRGANGVILVTTKKGKRNQETTTSLSYKTTIARPINKVKVLDASQYRDYYDLLIGNSVDAMNSGKLDPSFAFDLQNIGNVDIDFSDFTSTYNGLNENYFGNADTDWNDEVFRSMAITDQVNFGISGGTENTNYSLNLAHVNQEGVVNHDRFEQYNVGMSLNTDLSDKFTFGGTVNLGHTKAKSGEETVLGQYNVNTMVVRARPDLPVRGDNGNLLPQEDYENGFQTYEPNPLMRLGNDGLDKSYNFIGNGFLEYEPIENLKLKADINAAVFYSDNGTFVPKSAQTDMVIIPSTSFLEKSSALVSNVTTNLTANYEFRFDKHRFTTMIGAAWDQTKTDSDGQFYSGFPDDDVLTNPTSAEELLGYTGTKFETGLNSLFSRITYNYDSKYNATINFRTDTSSKFGPNNKRAYFPSISTSWNIAREDFLIDNEEINELKLRVSAGRVGSTNVADFAYIQFFNTSASDIYNGSSAVLPNDVFPNEDIGWETTDEINIGLDFRLLNSRIYGNVDVYNRKTDGALVTTPIPLELGSGTYYSNFIDVSNKGVEVSLGGDIIQTQDFNWSVNANWAVNRNKLDKFKGASVNEHQLDYFVEGEPVGTIKGYKVKEIIQSQDVIDDLNAASPTGVYDQPVTGVGDYLFEDTNGDGRITSADRTVIGDVEPDFFGGFSTNFSYKNFSVSAIFQYSVGAEALWDGIPTGVFNTLGSNKYQEYALNTWTPDNPDARYAKAVYFDPASNSRISDRYLYDTSYLRLKSLQISYAFEPNTLKKLGIDQARLTLSGNNLATWTKWPGVDPETFSERRNITSQTNNEDPYPLSKSFSLGVELQF